jgi:hypothetical protein
VVASTASPPTTTAPTTTAAPAAPAVAYSIEPKTCQQKGNSITYTATILNKSTAAFDYTITVVFKDKSGAAVANASANVAKLAPNKAIDFTATGTANKDLANTGASCDVQKVDAKPSGA